MNCFVSDLMNLPIHYRNNLGMRRPFRGPAWFKDTKFNNAIKFLFESLLMYVMYRINMVMYQISSRFEVIVYLLVRITSKGAMLIE